MFFGTSILRFSDKKPYSWFLGPFFRFFQDILAQPPPQGASLDLPLFSISNFESTELSVLLFTYLYRRSIIDTYLAIFNVSRMSPHPPL